MRRLNERHENYLLSLKTLKIKSVAFGLNPDMVDRILRIAETWKE